PALWSRDFPREARGDHQHDAYAVAEWMRRTDVAGELARHLAPPFGPDERGTAAIEGWILGVMESRRSPRPRTAIRRGTRPPPYLARGEYDRERPHEGLFRQPAGGRRAGVTDAGKKADGDRPRSLPAVGGLGP